MLSKLFLIFVFLFCQYINCIDVGYVPTASDELLNNLSHVKMEYGPFRFDPVARKYEVQTYFYNAKHFPQNSLIVGISYEVIDVNTNKIYDQSENLWIHHAGLHKNIANNKYDTSVLRNERELNQIHGMTVLFAGEGPKSAIEGIDFLAPDPYGYSSNTLNKQGAVGCIHGINNMNETYTFKLVHHVWYRNFVPKQDKNLGGFIKIGGFKYNPAIAAPTHDPEIYSIEYNVNIGKTVEIATVLMHMHRGVINGTLYFNNEAGDYITETAVEMNHVGEVYINPYISLKNPVVVKKNDCITAKFFFDEPLALEQDESVMHIMLVNGYYPKPSGAPTSIVYLHSNTCKP